MSKIIQVVQQAEAIVTSYMDIYYPNHARDQALAGRIGDLLWHHYPNHIWYVNVDSQPTVGIVKIYNGIISTSHSYNLHLQTVLDDPDLKCIVRAGGELLERANIKRGSWEGDVPTYVEGLPAKYQPTGRIVR